MNDENDLGADAAEVVSAGSIAAPSAIARHTPTAILEAAKAKIAQGWCQNVMVRYPKESAGLLYLHQGVAWCADGALSLCGEGPAYLEARSLVIQAAGCDSLWDWNDAPGRTQSEVLAVFDKAIELSKDIAKSEGR